MYEYRSHCPMKLETTNSWFHKLQSRKHAAHIYINYAIDEWLVLIYKSLGTRRDNNPSKNSQSSSPSSNPTKIMEEHTFLEEISATFRLICKKFKQAGVGGAINVGKSAMFADFVVISTTLGRN
ncbi:hypothetical protein Fot_23899 [Forsythia ovata]|uniref:Uncharacterized protein n=1 Tax=Forsythia ovata TaxID=205694 RepID=A0ABD1U4N0_9LAMI